MTGTADTEAYELQKIYGLEVVVIPTNKPMIRKDEADQIYLTAHAKFNAILDELKSVMQRGSRFWLVRLLLKRLSLWLTY